MSDDFDYNPHNGSYTVPVFFSDSLLGLTPASDDEHTLENAIRAAARRRLARHLGLSDYTLIADDTLLRPAEDADRMLSLVRLTAFPADMNVAALSDALLAYPRIETAGGLELAIYADLDARPAGDDWANVRLGLLSGTNRRVGVAEWVDFGRDPRNPRPVGLHIHSNSWTDAGETGRANHPADLEFCVAQVKALFEKAGQPLPNLFIGQLPPEADQGDGE